MTAIHVQVGRNERPASLMAAVALIVIGTIANVAALPWVNEDDFTTVLVVGSTLSVVWLASAWGTWQRIRWAAVLAFAVGVISGLLALPGIPFAEDTVWRVLSVVGLVHAVAVCWLLAMKSTRAVLR